MRFNGFIQSRDAAALHPRRLRQRGYDDGYAKRPATSALLVYQRSYLEGRKARVRDEFVSATKRKPTRAAGLGISDTEYSRMLEAQDGHCALCDAEPKVEHDARRSWKCRYCQRVNPPAVSDCTKCGKTRVKPKRFHVDHDHKTGKVRSLLCYRCNAAVPYWVTSDWALRLYGYLKNAEQAQP